MNKGCTLTQNVSILKWSEEFNISASYNLLSGFPGEHPEDYREMEKIIPLLTHLPEPKSAARFRLERFSPYFEASDQFGLCNIRPLKVFAAIFPIEFNLLADLALFFDFDYTSQFPPENYTQTWLAEVHKWKKPESVGTMIAANCGIYTFVLDRRFKKSDRITVLKGLESEIYDFCDKAYSLRFIKNRFNVPKSTLCALLDKLVDSKMILRIGNFYLSLAIRVDRWLGPDVNTLNIPDVLSEIGDYLDQKMRVRRLETSRQRFNTA